MRNPYLLCCAALFATFLPAVPARAQFQPPTPEELQMMSDPKAPGADAVYLYLEELDNDTLHYESHYARIKVLTEKGKEMATVELPYLQSYWKVTDIKGRTIHPDGTIVPLAGKPDDLLSEKVGDEQIKRKVFTLPSVDVGSILEYRYTISYGDNCDQLDGTCFFVPPNWPIQQPHFIHKAHFVFTPIPTLSPSGASASFTFMGFLADRHGRVATGIAYAQHLPQGEAVKRGMTAYTVDLTDVPPIPDEEWMPPISSVLFHVNFYYTYVHDLKQFWIDDGNLWSTDVDKFAEPSKAIQNAVNGLVAPGDSDVDKAKKLYAAVQALDNTDYSRQKTHSEMRALGIKEAKHAEDTWAQKSGSSEDIAMLYLAMLRAAGLNAVAVKVVDRDRAIFDPTFLNLEQLDTTLVAFTTGGKQMVLDPGEKMCPFGTVNWRHSGVEGLSQGDKAIMLSTTPELAYNDNIVSRTADLTLDAHGSVTGSIQIIMTGQKSLEWRQAALRNDESEVKKQFDRELEAIVPEGVEAHIDHFLGLDQPGQNLMAMVNVNGTMGTATAKRLLLPGLFFETRTGAPFAKEDTRLEPVDMRYAERVNDDVIYHFPAGMTVEGAPQDASVPWQGHAVFILKSKPGSDQIEIQSTLARAFSQAKPEEYQDLRGFYQKVAAAEQAQLVLKIAPETSATPATSTSTVPSGKGN
ncbi:MAG: DUF3857 and transglutaminase domain-containing protein [Terracidiphilus sp.]